MDIDDLRDKVKEYAAEDGWSAIEEIVDAIPASVLRRKFEHSFSEEE